MHTTEEITREIFWNVKGTGFPVAEVLTYLFALVAIAFFFVALKKSGFFNRFKMWKLGTGSEVDRVDNPWSRFWFACGDVFVHRKILREPYQGIFHIFIFWGFVLLFIGAGIDFLQVDIIYPIWHVHFMDNNVYLSYSVITDTAGLLVLIGVLMALARRYMFMPDWLDNKAEDTFILWYILVIIITGFMVEGLRMQATELQPGDPMNAYVWFSYMGRIFALPFASMSVAALETTHLVTWWAHLFITMSFIAYIGYSKLLHMFTTPVSIFLRSTTDQPPIKVMPPDMFETAETFGIHNLEEYSWKDLFDTESCMRCGRCVEACPAFQTDKPLKPRDVIQDLRTHLEEKSKLALDADGVAHIIPDEEYEGPALIGDILGKDTIWACTTCMACVEACPAYITQFPKLVDLRRYLVMMESDFPAEVMDVFKGMENNSNPWSIGAHTRADWAKGLDVPLMSEKGGAEYLFFVGCSGSFDDMNKKVAIALAKIFNAVGLDYAILGTEEGCCGDSAKKIGNEYLYQTLAQMNIELMNGYNVKKIITMCPHGYNTLKKDYRDLGGEYEVYHYTTILKDLIAQGRLTLKNKVEGLETLTYHDSCYLGRYNDIYDEPREILNALNSGSLVEMKSNHAKSFCCGAGGGRMWMEEDLGTRINQKRTQEALDAGAKTICTGCPFCYTMLSDGIKELELEDKLQAFDIAELVAKAAGLDEKKVEHEKPVES
ncbi:MAG: heterodisulfide reductase-related iron-sulfur binding cluster [Thermodesulfobacteriota bacterium]|nr:heterodisulfide reductase-related iron-sulfur binding cluster [Thermodesulfobacteriota bacterium]